MTDYVGEVRQDADGRWDWRVRTADGKRVTSCLKQIGCDDRPLRQKTAEKRVRQVIASLVRQDAAAWVTVEAEDE